MKIDIFYCPIYPKTRVRIDDKPIDGTDIYGFLYPVRNYILQTWLPESGSWHGFINELRDMTRGETAQLVFHGREVDYNDFCQCVRGVPNATVEFCRTDYISIFQKRLEQAKKLTKEIIDNPVIMEQDETTVKRSFKELYPDEYKKTADALSTEFHEWLANIESKSDVGKNIGESTCCLINGDSLLASNDYTSIDLLTASLTRSYDMIVCRFTSDEIYECFRQYNEQLQKYDIQIVLGDTQKAELQVKEKYGVVYGLWQQLKQLRNAYSIIEGCMNEVHTVPNPDKLDAESIRRELKVRHKKRWCSHQKNNISELRKLLFETDYMER